MTHWKRPCSSTSLLCSLPTPRIWIPDLSSPGTTCNPNVLCVQRSPGNREIRGHSIIVSREEFEEAKLELGLKEQRKDNYG